MRVLNGCTGQYSVFTAFLEPGDEVIMFEPFFDQYLPSVVFNGGVPVYVPLHPDLSADKPTADDWKIDFAELGKLPEYHVKATNIPEANINLRRPTIVGSSRYCL